MEEGERCAKEEVHVCGVEAAKLSGCREKTGDRKLETYMFVIS